MHCDRVGGINLFLIAYFLVFFYYYKMLGSYYVQRMSESHMYGIDNGEQNIEFSRDKSVALNALIK
jgi:hypothetical protein